MRSTCWARSTTSPADAAAANGASGDVPTPSSARGEPHDGERSDDALGGDAGAGRARRRPAGSRRRGAATRAGGEQPGTGPAGDDGAGAADRAQVVGGVAEQAPVEHEVERPVEGEDEADVEHREHARAARGRRRARRRPTGGRGRGARGARAHRRAPRSAAAPTTTPRATFGVVRGDEDDEHEGERRGPSPAPRRPGGPGRAARRRVRRPGSRRPVRRPAPSCSGSTPVSVVTTGERARPGRGSIPPAPPRVSGAAPLACPRGSRRGRDRPGRPGAPLLRPQHRALPAAGAGRRVDPPRGPRPRRDDPGAGVPPRRGADPRAAAGGAAGRRAAARRRPRLRRRRQPAAPRRTPARPGRRRASRSARRRSRSAADLVAAAGLGDRVRVREGDFLAPPADLAGADLVFSVEAFVHGPDPAAYFRAAAGLLRPGGLLVALRRPPRSVRPSSRPADSKKFPSVRN